MWDKTHYNNNEDCFKIDIYCLENGKAPFEEFLNLFDMKTKVRIIKMVDKLSLLGNNIRPPFSKKIDKYIYELRIITGNDISRVLYFFCVDRRIVITHGFVKKTNKTPKEEIEKANKYRNDWLRRNN